MALCEGKKVRVGFGLLKKDFGGTRRNAVFTTRQSVHIELYNTKGQYIPSNMLNEARLEQVDQNARERELFEVRRTKVRNS